MTYEEASKDLKYTIHESDCGNVNVFPNIEALENAVEALEKQIPKKPKIIHKKGQRHYNDKYLCPECGESVVTNCGDPFMDYGLDWCDHCGQKLDWSDEA